MPSIFKKDKKDKRREGTPPSSASSVEATPFSTRPTSPTRVQTSSATSDMQLPPMPEPAQLEEQFKQLLGNMGVPPEEWDLMIQGYSKERKWKMIIIQRLKESNVQNTGQRKKPVHPPQFFVDFLNNLNPKNPSAQDQTAASKTLNELRLALSSLPMVWVHKFADIGGVKSLVNVLSVLHSEPEKSSSQCDMMSHILRSFKVILDSKQEMNVFLTLDNSVKATALCINMENALLSGSTNYKSIVLHKVAKLALELLSVLVVSEEFARGHRMELEAFTFIKELKKEPARFQGLMDILAGCQDKEVLTYVMAFINGLINKVPDVDDRVALRNEFLALKFKEILSKLPTEVDVQVEVFYEEARQDEEELQGATLPVDVDASDPNSMCRRLVKELHDTPEFNSVKRLFVTMLSVAMRRKRDPTASLKTFVALEKLGNSLSRKRKQIAVEGTKFSLEDLFETVDQSAKMAELTKQLEELQKLKEQNKLLLKELKERAYRGTGGPAGAEGSKFADKLKDLGIDPLPDAETPTIAVDIGVGAPPAPAPPPLFGITLQPVLPEKFKKIPVPSVKMRGLHWNKFTQIKVRGTIWEEDLQIHGDLPFGEIEEHFGFQEKEEIVKAVPRARTFVSLINPKKAQNLGIVLGKLKLPFDKLKAAIVEGDGELLDSVMSKQLADYAPTHEDYDTIHGFLKPEEGESEEEKRSMLGKAEQFYLAISGVSRVRERLMCVYIRHKFPLKILEIKKEIRILHKATKQVKNSKKIIGMLEVIWTVGNFMNSGTFRGSALGFALDALLKLADVKSPQKNSYSLMHYLVKLIEEHFDHLKDFSTEIKNTQEASKLSLPTLLADLTELSEDLRLVNNEVNFLTTEGYTDSDPFYAITSSFYNAATLEMDETLSKFKETKTSFDEVLKLFGEDPKTQPEEFFSLWWQFVQMFSRCGEEMAKERINAERVAKREKAKAERLLQMEQKKKTKKEGADGLVENSLEQLMYGTLRASRDRRQEEPPEEQTEPPEEIANTN